MTLKDKVVLITGASSGIGKATALELGAQKARVALAARRKDRLDEVAAQIENTGGAALAVPTDVSVESQVQSLVAAVLKKWERIDVLINNAGSGLAATVEETSPQQIERIWRSNFMSAFYCIRSVLPVMNKQKSGHILAVSSMAGKRAMALRAAYCASKFALAGLMESLRMELRGSGIKTTVIYPGATETEFLEHMENPGGRQLRFHGPVQTPAKVAKAIVGAILRPSPEVITQPFGKSLVVLNAMSPRFVDWFVSNTIKRKSGK